MPIQCSCPECGYRYKVADDLVGRKVLCPECQTRFEPQGIPQVLPVKGRQSQEDKALFEKRNRRGVPAWAWIVGGSALGLLLLAFFVALAVKAIRNAPLPPRIPPDQAEFVKLINDYAARYRQAPNEIQKTELRFSRAAALKQSFSQKTITNWVGILKRLQTNQSGTTTVVIAVYGSDVLSVGTWNNALSDLGDGTQIARGSSLYNSLSQLTEGQLVLFSGELFPSSDRDFFREKSVTELGAMTEPEFLMRFTAISKLSANRKMFE
jgi:hypothetical protein